MTTPISASVPTPIDRITRLLEGAGYRRIGTPLRIGGIDFDLAGAFVGADPSPDLIVVLDSVFEDEQKIRRKVEGIARALDVVRSKRPLTAVIAGPRPRPTVLEAMARVCRVLPVGTIVDADIEEATRNWLAVLMPLRLPEPSATIADPLNTLTLELEPANPEIDELLKLAPQGAGAVQDRFHDFVRMALSDIKDESL